MGYETEHADALADVAEAGAPVTFTRAGVGTYNPATDTRTAAPATTIGGVAIQVPGNPDTYRALSLIQSEATTLFFVPENYGDRPKPGDTVVWNGDVLTVKDESALAPDGNRIASTVVCVR